jgi:hypothetical protein
MEFTWKKKFFFFVIASQLSHEQQQVESETYQKRRRKEKKIMFIQIALGINDIATLTFFSYSFFSQNCAHHVKLVVQTFGFVCH